MKIAKQASLFVLAVLLLAACHENKKTAPAPSEETFELQVGDSTVEAEEPTNKVDVNKQLQQDVLEATDQLPEFPGGYEAMRRYIKKHVEYPTAAREMNMEGRVIVGVHIDEQGRLSNYTIKQSDNALFEKPALKVVKQMPQWSPAKKAGKPIAVDYSVEVFFRLK